MTATSELKVGGRTLSLTNLDKILYPKPKFTKGQVIDYYARIGPVVLPHLKDRALTLKRYPNGVDQEFFYEKRCPSFRPSWFKTAPVWSETQHETICFCRVNDLPSLIWVANLADLELHTSLALYRKPLRPTALVFDLDPGEGRDVVDCAEVGLWLRKFLAEQKLECFAKTSGSKGLQIYVPLNTAVSFDQTKAYARWVAESLTAQHPKQVLFRMEKRLRRGKIFIDWSQNDDHKTTVCVYSLRAKEQPTVSTPLHWQEIERGYKTRTASRLVFATEEVIKRADKEGDLFAPVLTLKQKLPKIPSAD